MISNSPTSLLDGIQKEVITGATLTMLVGKFVDSPGNIVITCHPNGNPSAISRDGSVTLTASIEEGVQACHRFLALNDGLPDSDESRKIVAEAFKAFFSELNADLMLNKKSESEPKAPSFADAAVSPAQDYSIPKFTSIAGEGRGFKLPSPPAPELPAAAAAPENVPASAPLQKDNATPKRKVKEEVFSMRIDPELKDSFAAKCEDLDLPQSAVIRRLMKKFVQDGQL